MKRKLADYRAEVRRRLITNEGWSAERFNNFTTEYPEYIKAMWESAAPEGDTVEYMSEMDKK